MLRMLIVVAALVFAMPAVQAEEPVDPAKADLAQQILGLSTTGPMIKATSAAIWPTVRGLIVDKNPDVAPAVLAELEALMETYLGESVTAMSGAMVDFYAREFEADELESILAFYSSGAGKKLIEKTPLVAQQLMPEMMAQMQQVMPRIMDVMKKAVQDRGLKV